MSSARSYHHSLRPLFRNLATTLVEGSPGRSDLAPLFDDMPPPDDPRLRGPSLDDLERIVDAIERAASP